MKTLIYITLTLSLLATAVALKTVAKEKFLRAGSRRLAEVEEAPAPVAEAEEAAEEAAPQEVKLSKKKMGETNEVTSRRRIKFPSGIRWLGIQRQRSG